MFRFCSLFFPILIICAFASPRIKADDPVQLMTSEMDSLEKKLEWVNYRLSLEQWENDFSGYSDSLDFYNDLYLYVISSSNIYDWAADGNNLTDRTERQRLQILLAETLTDRLEQNASLAKAKDTIFRTIESFKVDFQGEEKTLAQVRGIYFNSRSRTQREQACRAWYSVGEELLTTMKKLIKERNEAAEDLGFDNYWELISSQFSQNGVDIAQLLKSIDSLTQTANSALFEQARTALGVTQIELWDIPFMHAQISEQADTFFPADSQFSYISRGLTSIGFDLDKLPVYIQEVKTRPIGFGTRSYSVKAPHDIRVLTKLQNGFDGIRQLLYHIGIALHSNYIAQDRPLYNFAADTTWQMAMGEIVASIATDSLWLTEVINMPVGFITSFRQTQFERAIIELRQLLADITFIQQAYSNPDRDLNGLYWDILQKYSGLMLHEDVIIWTTVPELISDPSILVSKLLSKSIAAQSVNYMTTYFGPLMNNSNTSSFLVQNYFRFGSRYSWSELLQRGTGEKLSPIHIKKFF